MKFRIFLLLLVVALAGLYVWADIRSSPQRRVAVLSPVNLPQNAELVYEYEEGNPFGYGYHYIFKLDRKYACKELGLVEVDKVKDNKIREYIANKQILDIKIKCIYTAEMYAIDEDSNKIPYRTAGDKEAHFSAFSNDEFLEIYLSSAG